MHDQYANKSIAHVKRVARIYGVSPAGSKAEIVARIVAKKSK